MTRYLSILLIFFYFNSFSQSTEEYKIKYAINTFFNGLQVSDSLKMRSVMNSNFTIKSIQANDNGKNVLINQNVNSFLTLVTKYAKLRNWEEELLLIKIEIDGDLAHAWCPYEFYLNDMLSHCGANSIQLFKEGDQWKILSIIDTRRKNCGD